MLLKYLSFRGPSVNLESIRNNLTTEILKEWKRSFYTTVPVSYKENILNVVVPKIGVDFEEEKDVYQVKVFLFLYASTYPIHACNSSYFVF